MEDMYAVRANASEEGEFLRGLEGLRAQAREGEGEGAVFTGLKGVRVGEGGCGCCTLM